MIDKEDGLPKVSVLIRTYQRVNLLERAVRSVQLQTYPNIEVVIVEDGANTAEQMLQQKFPQMNIRYVCLEKRCGRSRAGNRAMELATGTYCNFLDDDDQLYPQHIKALVESIENSSCRLTYAQALEVQIDENTHKIKRKLVRQKVKPNRLLLYAVNYLPIQCVLFERSLFVEYGGFDECLETLEDWDLWLRFTQATRLGYVPDITSEYYTPYKSKSKKNRDKAFRIAHEMLIKENKDYQLEITTSEIMQEIAYILSEYKRSGLFFYLRKFRDLVLYGDT